MFSLTQNYLTRGFWGDEAWTSLISQLPYKEMLKTTAADFHPPGYYTIIELWYKIFPTTEVSTRIVSIIFYLLTIFMVYKLASYASVILNDSEGSRDSSSSTQNDRKTFLGLNSFGLISAAVVAVNPIFFTYAFEARNYTMFAFAATGSVFFLIELSKQFTLRRALAFILFSTLGIYTHYYMFFILAAQGLYLILLDRGILLRMIGVYVAIGVLYLPWIPFLLGQLNSVAGDYWIGGIDKRTHFEALLRILGGEHKNAFRPWLFGISAALLIIGLIQHALGRADPSLRSRQEDGQAGQRFEKPYLLTWLWAVVPFILATLPGLKVDGISLPFRPIFFWRYLIGSSVPLAMVMVHAAQKLKQPLSALSMVGLITLSVLVDVLTFSRVPYSFREVYKQNIIGQIRPDDKIVTVLPSFAEVLYYRNRFGIGNDLVVLPEGIVQFSGKSLLDAYVANGTVTISQDVGGRYFEMRPGQMIIVKQNF